MNSNRNQLILVFALVFGVFYITVYGDICSVDDYSNLVDLANMEGLTVKQIFLPHCVGGGYYRPLVWFSYFVNLKIWDLNGMTLHLENVLLHTVNALLVYFLALSLLPREKRQGSLIPLAAALIFGLHPISTESVDWISGRTDLIAGCTVFIAAILVVRYLGTRSRWLIAVAAGLLLVGMLAKETALFFLPGAFLMLQGGLGGDPSAPAEGSSLPSGRDVICFLLFATVTVIAEIVFFNFWPVLATAPLYAQYLYRQKARESGAAPPASKTLRTVAIWGAVVLAAVATIYVVRSVVFTSSITKFFETVKVMLQEPNHTISIFLGGIGFYCKKFLFPLPLNFAIREVDPAYNIVGTFLLFIGIALTVRRTFTRSLVLTGVFLFAPALPLALGTVAWTAYAERYIYISSAFWSIALVLWLAPHMKPLGKRGVAAVAALLLLAGVITLQRNLIWQSSLTLMRDTVQKSPRFREARGIYMAELMKVDDLKGATEQYQIACSLPAVRYDERLDNAMATIHLRQGREDEAIKLYEQVYRKTRGKSSTARSQLVALLKGQLAKAQRPAERREIQLKLQRYQEPATADAKAASPVAER